MCVFYLLTCNCLCHVKEADEMSEGASVPALGLSNKAVYTSVEAGCGTVVEDSHKKDQYSESYFIPQHLTGCLPVLHVFQYLVAEYNCVFTYC